MRTFQQKKNRSSQELFFCSWEKLNSRIYDSVPCAGRPIDFLKKILQAVVIRLQLLSDHFTIAYKSALSDSKKSWKPSQAMQAQRNTYSPQTLFEFRLKLLSRSFMEPFSSEYDGSDEKEEEANKRDATKQFTGEFRRMSSNKFGCSTRPNVSLDCIYLW